ncbi:3-deoxy-7-phosphoheptulonate synthase [Halothermothrix orenii]|uniref:Phospho-2-dehydro-3-deoxyheptonate aldolase n=1 Tax=Halothermothrix orenii (strain H 168 / OCM 544 / DSM 9562) TaxID=373903 RepID=B8CWX2_HALOH|nr:3-deoxy-7-phosphoheptulonate synthase [Halothermothrix orenii]ACL69791.1 phospho-2-dehydro-3-deoxyheptonate aldolase [Halothermothrix orenii H 168]
MIVVMKDNASKNDIEKVVKRIEELGYKTHISRGTEITLIGIIGELNREELIDSLGAYPGIERLVPIQEPYKLAGKSFNDSRSRIKIGEDVVIGGKEVVMMAGPCAVESEQQIINTARAVKKAGAKILRGGAFKPRTSPYSFQGLHEKGLKYLKKAAEETGLKVITEVMDPRDVELVARYADIFQIGARNMQNFFLLKEVGKTDKPVMLKRGMNATYKEFLMAAEYIMSEGNHDVILCERGIRTFETYTRNTLDLVSVPVLNKLSHLPVVIDPSHGTGQWDLVGPAARGAVAIGADGLIIEVHPEPINALSDGQQSLKFDKFEELVDDLKKIARAIGRDL